MKNNNELGLVISKLAQAKQRILNEISSTVITDNYLMKLSGMSDIYLTRVMRLMHTELGNCIARVEQTIASQKSE